MNEFQRIKQYMQSDIVRNRFVDILGHDAKAYITSVLLVVANDPTGKLAKCTPQSIYSSALRAASMRLSVDPAIQQAYLVPFKGQATLVVGYKGLYYMALRTGQYRYINVGPVHDGMCVEENPITGLHTITGHRKNDQVLGWIGAFKLITGFAKTLYMTVEEIHKHAEKYSAMYSVGGVWKSHTAAMEQKTVLRILLYKWGYLDPSDVRAMNDNDAVAETVVIDNTSGDDNTLGDSIDATETKSIASENEILAQLGFDK